MVRLEDHKRRYCRGPPTETEGECEHCPRTFSSYQALQLHKKGAHATGYEVQLEREVLAKQRRNLWMEMELEDIARDEAEYIGTELLQHLADLKKGLEKRDTNKNIKIWLPNS